MLARLGLAISLAASGVAIAQPQPGAGAVAGAGEEATERDLQVVHATNVGQVELARVALDGARSPHVAALAQRLLDGHLDIDRRLGELAHEAQVDLVGGAFQLRQSEALEAAARIDALAGPARDRAYVDQVILMLRRDSRDIAAAARGARQRQPSLAAFLEESARRVEHHLERALAVQEALAREQRGGRRAAGAGAARAGDGAR
jgi:predicted outer membrane protein